MEEKEKVSKKFLIVTALYENDLNCPTVLLINFFNPLVHWLMIQELGNSGGAFLNYFAHLFDESLIRTCTF